MDIQVKDGSSIELADAVFGVEFKEPLVHQYVVAYMAKSRSGTKAQKNRSAVSGGGAKPWRQKGTGRARAGTSRSPLWRHGGVTFAAQPRSFEQKINKKMVRAANRSIFSELARQERLIVVESLQFDTPKTKDAVAKLADLGVNDAVLIDVNVADNVVLATRNLHKIEVADVASLSPVQLVGRENTVITVEALRKIEEWLS